MAKKTRSWLIGCGIGCGAILVLGILLIGPGYYFVSDTLDGFDGAITIRETLEEKFGTAEEFTPWSDGVIPSDRMEVFLAVREATDPARDAIAALVSGLPLTPEKARELDEMSFMERMGAVLDIPKSALGGTAGRGDFFKARNQAMLDEGMGMGEYIYIYTLAYHSWLKIRTDEGLDALELDEEVPPGRGPFGDDGFGGRRRQSMLVILRNQLDALPEGDAEADALRVDLEEQIGAMEEDPGRVPWQANLPDRILASLQPYRQRLIETYNPLSDTFELARSEKKGPLVYVE